MVQKRDSLALLLKRLKRMQRFSLMSEVQKRTNVHYNTICRLAQGKKVSTSVATFDTIMDAIDEVEAELKAELEVDSVEQA